MKTLLILLLAFTPLWQRHPPRPVLFDFRNERTAAPQKISPATERDVLSKVFRRYLVDSNRCKAEFDAGEDFLAGARHKSFLTSPKWSPEVLPLPARTKPRT
jgi:hypothetical protein